MFDAILQAAWEGFLLVFSWPNILYPVIGTLLVMYFALLPGLSGATLMALAIPVTFSMEPIPVMLIFGAFVNTVGFLKGKSAIRIHREYLGRKRNLTGFHFWARRYCA